MADDGVLRDRQTMAEICNNNYKNQAVWFLNAVWQEWGANAPAEAEKIWNFVHKCHDLDLQNRENGKELDELNAHRFLEAFNETMTVRAMRTRMRETLAVDASSRFKMVPLLHVLIFRGKYDWRRIVNAAQGDNSKAIEEAERKLKAVQTALDAAQAAADKAAAALQESKRQQAAAEQAAADSRQREQDALAAAQAAAAAKVELERALAEVKAQEDAYNAKTEDLKRKSETGGVVSRNRAKNELAQHLAEDPLPLRRAKITAEAAVKKADRTRVASEKAAAEAAAAMERSAQAKAAAEAAVAEAQAAVAEAEEFLRVEKAKPGVAQGAIWWLERELYEKKKYLPEAKGGIRR